MEPYSLAPWLPPAEPDLARLSMEVADRLGVAELRAWPEHRSGGIGFWILPPFLAWHGRDNGGHHLVLLQAREVGALVPGARMEPLPNRWLVTLDLESLARPLAHHPAWNGEAASVHVVSLKPGSEAPDVWIRTYGTAAPDLVRAVLERVSSERVWRFAD